jgi:hypothetical protein
MCMFQLITIGSGLFVLRDAGGTERDAESVAGVPRTTRAFRHGDPGDLGPGSHDAVTPDELSQSKYLSKPDPTILAHEIKNQAGPQTPPRFWLRPSCLDLRCCCLRFSNQVPWRPSTQPRVEREKRHGDPTGLGPGSYDWAKPRPRTCAPFPRGSKPPSLHSPLRLVVWCGAIYKLAVRCCSADEPGRASSAFVGPGHGMDSFSSAHEVSR